MKNWPILKIKCSTVRVKVIEERLILTSNGGLRYVAEWKNGRIEHKMDHLACFIGSYAILSCDFHDNYKKVDSVC